jgi:diguanylate cyclase (GGDEF)-like protein
MTKEMLEFERRRDRDDSPTEGPPSKASGLDVRREMIVHVVTTAAERLLDQGDIYHFAAGVAALIREHLGLDQFAIIRVDRSAGMAYHLGHAATFDWPINPGYRQPLEIGITGRAARTGKSVFVADVKSDPDYVAVVDGVRSEIVVPVMHGGELLALINSEALRPESIESNLTLLESIAAALAPLLARAVRDHKRDEVLRRAERQAQQLAIINEVARIALLDLELRPMLQRVIEALSSKFGWEFVAVVTIDSERGVFTCEAVTSRYPTVIDVGYCRAIGTGIVGEVALTGCPILVDDVRRFPNYVETTSGVLSELCVPVKQGDRVIAILNLESSRYAAFQDQLELLTTVADQVAGAIANARLYEEVVTRASHMEMMSELSRAALEAGELQLVLDRVVNYIDEKFELCVESVMLLSDDGQLFEIAAHSRRTPIEAASGTWPVSGIAGRAVRSGQPQLVLDVTTDPDYIEIDPSVVAEFALPIRFQDRILGVMNLEASDVRTFSPDNVRVLQTLADQIAGAIHLASLNQRLLETNRLVQQKSQELELVNEELVMANRMLHRLSMHDGLTGVANRRHFDETLELEWRRAIRTGGTLSLIMVDIDRFKPYNDAFGHLQGDECLKQVAYALSGCVQRAGELVARYGGEEFALILPATTIEAAEGIARHARDAVIGMAVPQSPRAGGGVVTISAGVATLRPQMGQPSSHLIAAADHALYLAKRAGGNSVVRSS